MQNFVRNLLTEWRRLDLPFADRTVVAAVSGGADSVSLLLALSELRRRKKLNSRVVAAHFNHRLRGEASDADEQFVADLASRLDFEWALGKSEITGEKGNLEQNARDARYRFLAETAERLDAHSVLTAHTLNDQAETFLFNLLRGSGLDGLGGMKPIRLLKEEEKRRRSGGEEERRSEEYAEVSRPSSISSTPPLLHSSSPLLARPLLGWAKREDTENFCRLNEIEFRYDAMNEDLKFNRVRIRKVLLPLLKDFNPKIVETLARTANLLREDAEHLSVVRRPLSIESQNAADDAQQTGTEDPRPKTQDQIKDLSLKELKDVFPSMRRTILRDWLKDNRGNLRGLELKHIEAIERLAFSRKSGRRAELPGGEIVTKQDGKLRFQNAKVEK